MNLTIRKRIFLVVFIIGIGSSVLISTTVFQLLYNELEKQILLKQDLQLKLYQVSLLGKLEIIENILHAADTNQHIIDFLKLKQTSEINVEHLRHDLEIEYQSFMIDNSYISQIRLLDAKGFEVMRIQKTENKIQTVPSENLQDKSKRDYFVTTTSLMPGEIYTSELDLNIEFEKIVVPYEPTVRKSIPIYDNDEILGIFVINMNLSQELEKLNDVKQGTIYLIDKDGNFLHNPDETKTFGHILNTGENYFSENQELKEKISAKDLGILFNESKTEYIVWEKIFFNKVSSNDYWVLLNIVPSNVIFSSIDYVWWILGVSLVIGGIIILAIVVLVTESFSKPIISLTKLAKEVSQGNLSTRIKSKRKDEFGKLSESFNSMLESLERSINEQQNTEKKLLQSLSELEKADLQKDEFTAMITHELKTPLTPILGYVQMLLADKLGKLTDKQKDILREIKVQAENLQRLIDDILDSKKLDMGKISFQKNNINVSDMLNLVQKSHADYLTDKKINFIVSCNTEANIKTDEVRLMQVFGNLIKNSVDFVSDKNGRIEIGAEETDDNKIKFYVKDNGIGIPKSKQKDVFKKFYQVDTTLTRKHGGTGLGLIICRGIIEGMGGKIWVESEPGKGTTVYFTVQK